MSPLSIIIKSLVLASAILLPTNGQRVAQKRARRALSEFGRDKASLAIMFAVPDAAAGPSGSKNAKATHESAQAATTLLRKRSQVHKSNRYQRRQKGQENHQANLGLSRHGRHLAGHDGAMSHSPMSTTTTATEASAIITPPSDLCSCSPVEYNFQLNLNQDCENNNDIDGKPGIGLTFCSIDRSEEQNEDDIEITSIEFLEFDASGNLIVINTDDTSYANTSLSDGDIATFKSISSDLDPDVPIEYQLDYVPGGVQLYLQGRVVDGITGEEKIVSSRITWTYTNACDVEPLEAGQSIGWSTFGELERASDAFCPAAATTTTSTTTTSTTPAMSMHSKSSRALFGKSCKGGYKSKTEKESP